MGENVDERIEAIRANQAAWAEHGDQRTGNSILADDVPWLLKLIDQRAELVMFNAIPGSANLRVQRRDGETPAEQRDAARATIEAVRELIRKNQCTDHNCVFGKMPSAGGMGTNGGCGFRTSHIRGFADELRKIVG